MTGNDIVDLVTAAKESNWRRKGFLEKIFTQKEQQHINHAALTDEMVWRLWTMKESAYKIYTRQYGGRFFAPQKFSCTLLSKTTGQVTVDTFSYQTITNTAKNYIYSIAMPQEYFKPDFYNCSFRIPGTYAADQQKFIYAKLIAKYADIKGTDKNDFKIIKDTNNIPFLYSEKEKIKIPVSITHHGNYAAFTIN
jgi:phosphopantetheinyl transferase (holo-ACP synthase)